MTWEDKLEKITSRTVPLYAMIVLLVIFANPSWTSCRSESYSSLPERH